MTEVVEEAAAEAPSTDEVVEPGEAEEDEVEQDEELEQPDEGDELEGQDANANELQLDEIMSQAGRYANTYRQNMEGKLGPMAEDVRPCPRCIDFLPGYFLPVAINNILPDQKAQVLLSIGEGVEPTYKQADRATTCNKCEGLGKVATGSKVRGKVTITCPECSGDGWLGPMKAQIPEAPAPVYVTPQAQDNGEPQEKPEVDPWGRPKGHALYGVFPGYEPE